MRRRSLGIVGFSLCFFAFAAEASAQCAWVLWEELEYFPIPAPAYLKEWPSKSWKIIGAQEKLTVCEAVLTAVWRAQLANSQPGADKPGIKATRSAPGVVTIDFKGDGSDFAGGSIYKYVCLPDTVDPRGPKGR